jgi:hypothetical protein
MDPITFQELCRLIGRIGGVPNEEIICAERMACHLGYNDEPCVVYQDTHIRIALEKTTLALAVTRLENNNPVLVVAPNGNVIRFHGEAHELDGHVAALAWNCIPGIRGVMV